MPGVVWTQIASAIRSAASRRQVGLAGAGQRAIGAAEREVTVGFGRRDPEVVHERGAVEELAVEVGAIEGRERQPVHPRAVAVARDGGGLLGARLLGRPREAGVGCREGAHIHVSGAGGQPPERKLGAADGVLELSERDRREQPAALGGGQAAAGAAGPGQPAEAIGSGRSRSTSRSYSATASREN